MTAPKPLISVRGSSVVWKQGGTTKRYHTGSHGEAIELAAQLDEAWEAEVLARRAVYDRLVARGADVVHPPAADEPEPEPVPVDDSPPAPTPDDDIVTVDISWDPIDERVALTFTATADVTLWRSVGGRSSTFEVSAGQPLHRTFKAVDEDVLEVRLDGPDGELVATGTFGEHY